MTKELFDAMKTIGNECKKYESCYDCPLATDRYQGSLCIFKHLNPYIISTNIISKEVYELNEHVR